ncbi:unnamed protein product [Trichogramma brassicae]|uniref:CCHC-type domain-containing protein n=1 Tax=Trichogramma brassicae TaxID=86971 RepID=A0A6H5J4Z5_9HYME|nr:unnamed protein product [Trichogramma brassicae]
MIEIRDLDECTTKVEIADALSTSLNAPHLNKDVVKTLRKAYVETQAAVAALPDDLAAKALKLGHIRIGWVNCRIRGREDTLRCYRCWSPGHVSAHCNGPDRSAHCFRCGPNRPSDKGLQEQSNVRFLPGARRCPRPCVDKPVLPPSTEDPSSPPMMRILQLNLNHCKAAQDLLSQTILEQCINVAVVYALANLEAALLNTGDTPTFAGALGYSVIDLTFASDTLAPQITSWAVSEPYTHSDHQAIVFEIETARPPRPTTRQSCKWNARTLDSKSLSVMMANASVPPRPTEEMKMRLMTAITSVCDASMAKTSGRRRRCAVYWWTSEIADLRHSCLRAQRLALCSLARGRTNEGACQTSYASARRLLRAAIKKQAPMLEQTVQRGQRGCMGQTLRDSHVPSQRTESKYSKLTDPGAPHSGCPVPSRASQASSATTTPGRSNYTSRHPGRTSKSMQEDQGRHCAWTGRSTKLCYQDRHCHAP